MSPSDRRLIAIMFTDMVGFTSAARRNEAVALELLREQEGIVRRTVAAHDGREVKSTGDGALVEFPSALRAAECAIQLQTELHARNVVQRERPIHLRIGIHVGDVEGRDGDIFGSEVNIAARMVSVAEPDGIALSEPAAVSLENRLALPIENVGTSGLKGIDRPLTICRIALPWSGPVDVSVESAYPRIAVLPLRNISPDGADAYFADGLTEELSSVLGRLEGLRVIARPSVARFGVMGEPLTEVAKQLGVSAVLDGSVRKAGEALRVSLRLVDATNQESMWSETFDGRLSDVFEVQSEIARRTAMALQIRLRGSDRAARVQPPTGNLEAYGLFLQGLHELRAGPPGPTNAAAEFFRRALSADPNFAAAHAQLAHRLIAELGETRSARDVVPQARVHVDRALALDPHSSEAHAARANLAMQADQAWGVAEAEFRRALELNPSDEAARLWFGLMLRALQRFPEALEQFQAAVHLNPLDPVAQTYICSVYRLQGALDRAEEYARGELARNLPPPIVHMALAYTYAYAGRDGEARREIELGGSNTGVYAGLDRAVLLASLGDPGLARDLLRRMEHSALQGYVPLVELAAAAAVTGEVDKALAFLEKDWTDGDRGLWFVYQGLAFDSLRTDSRFVELVRRMGLPTSVAPRRGSGS